KDSHGMTAFILDRPSKGMKVVKKEEKLGLLAANLVTLKFQHCLVSKSNILGSLNEGFKIAMWALDIGRIGIAAQALGFASGAFQSAVRYAKERVQFGHPIGENQGVGFKLADMQVKLNAADLLLFKACWQRDRKQPFHISASEAKLFCSEV